jgi:uncharacterized RDD family membrane protein YckC
VVDLCQPKEKAMNTFRQTKIHSLAKVSFDLAPPSERCGGCGAALQAGAHFCIACGAPLMRQVVVAEEPAVERPALVLRLLAEVIDRLAPLPFALLGYFWPGWLVVVFAWHLLRDCSPQRRSFGKMICRLRVVAIEDQRRCVWGRAMLRRIGSALSQTAYCLPELMFWAFVYDLVSLAFVLLSPAGRRMEDYLAQTVVVSERSYRRRLRALAQRGERLPQRAALRPR